MKSSYKLDEIGPFQLILLLEVPKPNCFLNAISWIQNSNYHDFLHWKINTKAQLATEMKSRFLATKIVNLFFFSSHQHLKWLRNGARNARENITCRNLRHNVFIAQAKMVLQTNNSIKNTSLKTALCLVFFHPCMMAQVIPLPPKFVVATNYLFLKSIFRSQHPSIWHLKNDHVHRVWPLHLQIICFTKLYEGWWDGVQICSVAERIKLNLPRTEFRFHIMIINVDFENP